MSTQYLSLPQDRILRREWDSMGAFVQQMKQPAVGHPACNGSEQNNPSWSGSSNYQQAIDWAEKGWLEGLERIKAMTGALKKLEGDKADRHIPRFCESGDEVDIGRFVSGEPENMIDFDVVQVPAAGRVVKLVVNISASCGVSADAMFRRGAAAVMLADLIEQSGLRSEIVVVSGGTRSGQGPDGVDFRVTVKRADQPLELDRVAFMLASPAAFRRLMFRAYEQLTTEEFNKHIGWAYTTPMNIKVEGEGNIEVDSLQYGFGNEIRSDADAVKFVEKMLASLVDGGKEGERIAA